MKGKCSNCKVGFQLTQKQRHNFRHGRNVFCSRECLTLSRGFVPGGAKYKGTCRLCGKAFVSKIKNKTYCSIDCYTSDPGTIDRLKKISPKGIAARAKKLELHEFGRTYVSCAYCGEKIEIIVSRKKRARRFFCNQTHYRKYLAERFDRWIASPQAIALPQNYDEFMTQEVLPCIVEGCEWEGQHLSAHANLEHGITAEELKKMAGFNLGTGLVCPDVSQKMSEKAKERGCNGLVPGQGLTAPRTNYRSLEGKEHHKKTMVLFVQREL